MCVVYLLFLFLQIYLHLLACLPVCRICRSVVRCKFRVSQLPKKYVNAILDLTEEKTTTTSLKPTVRSQQGRKEQDKAETKSSHAETKVGDGVVSYFRLGEIENVASCGQDRIMLIFCRLLLVACTHTHASVYTGGGGVWTR